METTLNAELRDDTGKGAARTLRATGRVPGILYGHGMEPREAQRLRPGSAPPVPHDGRRRHVGRSRRCDGQTHLAIPREIQRDHIHGRFIHIDFLAVRRDERITLAVEVHEIGEAPASRPAA